MIKVFFIQVLTLVGTIAAGVLIVVILYLVAQHFGIKLG